MEQFNGIASDSMINKTGGKHMNDEIKTEDIIESLRICAQGNPNACAACAYYGIATCYEELCEDAADRLEMLNTFDKTQSAKLLGKINALATENELLRGALASCGVPENAGAVRIKVDRRTDRFADTSEKVPDDERIMRQAIETYGVQAQCDVAIEEMAELTKAIMKIRRVADDYGKTQVALDNLLEEIADVDIMIEQMKIMWGPKQVEEYRRKKLERLDRRLNDDRNRS